MRLMWRDAVATALVGGSVALYAMFRQGTDLPVVSGPRGLAAVLLVAGLAACAVGARNPATEERSRGDRAVIAVASTLGPVALVAALVVFVTGSELVLGGLVAVMVALWLLATARHAASPTGAGNRTGTVSRPQRSGAPAAPIQR